ncbi:cardiolipin synthase [Paenibacillus sp. S-12]|uniref:cardiolipin synthase n=1 Tax=Paenibacillus sp. S-12 TaxID=3031371 RepID=UPI0025A1E7BF|nr:cardiolipin synthase [Paenibacillus sp. S-12]
MWSHLLELAGHWIPIINLLFAAVVIFLERRNVGGTWAWLMLLLLLPFIGFIFYILFGQNLARRKVYRIKPRTERLVRNEIASQVRCIEEGTFAYANEVVQHYEPLIYMNLVSSYSPLTQNNEVTVIADGRDMMDRLVERIQSASNHVHLLYYKLAGDATGRRIIDALTECAANGVEVRLLYDDIGSPALKDEALADLHAAGAQIYRFFPSRIPYVNLRVNYRNHRKIAVIDGQVGFVGGFNIGDEYVSLDPKIGHWRDTHLELQGGAVHRLQGQFLLDWSTASGQYIHFCEQYFPTPMHTGNTPVQIVSSGPDSDKQQIRNALLKLIFEAKERIYVQTPYLVPDDSVLIALKVAVQSGVDVRIMIPKKGDSRFVQWASNSYVGELLRAGAKCYWYEKGFLHAKTMVVDGLAATVGTANLDHRSFSLNFEINAFLYDRATAEQLDKLYEQDMKESVKLHWNTYRKRPIRYRFVESLARLVSPIL